LGFGVWGLGFIVWSLRFADCSFVTLVQAAEEWATGHGASSMVIDTGDDNE
jgi:hypothetical protein